MYHVSSELSWGQQLLLQDGKAVLKELALVSSWDANTSEIQRRILENNRKDLQNQDTGRDGSLGEQMGGRRRNETLLRKSPSLYESLIHISVKAQMRVRKGTQKCWGYRQWGICWVQPAWWVSFVVATNRGVMNGKALQPHVFLLRDPVLFGNGSRGKPQEHF